MLLFNFDFKLIKHISSTNADLELYILIYSREPCKTGRSIHKIFAWFLSNSVVFKAYPVRVLTYRLPRGYGNAKVKNNQEY